MRSILCRRDVVGSGPGRDGRTVMGHAQRELSGQAPNQASNSERAGAGDHERTSRLKGTKPIRCCVTLVITDMQPSRTPELQGGYSHSGVLPDAPLAEERP